MSLRIKFNVVMMTAFLAGLVLAAVLLNAFTRRSARDAVMSEAALMMGEVNATIHYTDTQVTPLLAQQMNVQFLPQAIPFYAAQQTFDRISVGFPSTRSASRPTIRPTPPTGPLPGKRRSSMRWRHNRSSTRSSLNA